MADDAQMADPGDRHVPRPIRKLDEAVVNRIAAGEIIHRPANALKELIENSLDAGATQIKVTLKEGGLKLLQIQDNGCGIRVSDLPILCERFTTSKLSSFSDLSKIATYGFRGEALASISHVAHLSVVTKTREDSCAWKASYSDGVLLPSKPGAAASAKPTAGNDGTTITAEDLFYNVPTRRRALKSATEEYGRVLDVVTRYAVHNAGVSFVCKKATSNAADVSTPSSNATVLSNIRLLYGSAIARELVRLETGKNVQLGFEGEGWFTNANWSAKKTTMLLFINHRLVESSSLKRSLEALYSNLLPKGGHPFMYLSLLIDPHKVDVNVHPTKREVHFLDEDDVIEAVCKALQDALVGANTSRTFAFTQTLLPGAASIPETGDRSEKSSAQGGLPMSSRKGYPQHVVRVNQNDRTLHAMVPNWGASQSETSLSRQPSAQGEAEGGKVPESETLLESVKAMRKEVMKQKHSALTDVLQNMTFVGIVDLDLSLSLIQHATKLYLINHFIICEEYAYQMALRQFGAFRRLKLDPPPSIRELVALAIAAEADVEEKADMSKEEATDTICSILLANREMMNEYFSMCISESGELESLPMLLKGYTPNLDRLPDFLMRLGPQVDWSDERACFETFLRELAWFYVPAVPSGSSGEVTENDADGETLEADRAREKQIEASEKWHLQHTFLSGLRKYFVAPKRLLEAEDVVQVTDLQSLYRVFERC